MRHLTFEASKVVPEWTDVFLDGRIIGTIRSFEGKLRFEKLAHVGLLPAAEMNQIVREVMRIARPKETKGTS